MEFTLLRVLEEFRFFPQNYLAFSTNMVWWKQDFGIIWTSWDWKEERMLT